MEGRIAVVTTRGAGMRWTWRRCPTSGARRVRRSGVVLAPQILGVKSLAKPKGFAKGDGGKRDGSPGRAPISRKPSRREGRCDHRRTCGFRALAQFFCANAPGAAATRPSLRPLFPEGDWTMQSSDDFGREDDAPCSLDAPARQRGACLRKPEPISYRSVGRDRWTRMPDRSAGLWVPARASLGRDDGEITSSHTARANIRETAPGRRAPARR
jgi:hypothetical protein